jgi:peptidoglycan-associated lipoprotein
MNNKALLISIFVLLSVFVYAQPSAVINARTAYLNTEYFKAASEAVTAYQRISPKNKRARKMKSEMAYIAGRSYEYIFNFDEAQNWYQRCIDLRYEEYQPDIFFRIANIQRQNGEYEKAKENYERYLELVPVDKRAELALQSMQKAVVLKDNRTRYTVKNEMKINTEHMEMTTAIASRRGDLIVFGSTRKSPVSSGKDQTLGEPFFNLWQVGVARDGNWLEPELFQDADSINTEASEGTAAFDERFRRMFFTRCPKVDKKDMGCQIWMSERRGRSWGAPVRVTLQEHDSISVGHPCPTADGNGLIFASDRPGGHGGMDLWYTEYDRRSDSWSDPINLGDEINTPGDELFPTFGLNGDLFFSSNGHKGLGGLDIFRAEQQGANMRWRNPTNMGTPINSDADDFHFTEVDKRRGYFTSNRRGSKGTRNMSDIWSYELPPNIFDLKVYVNEIGGDSRIAGATVEVTSEDGSFRGVTNSEGVIFWDKQVNGDRFINEERSYEVKILPLEGYHQSDEVSRFTTVGLDLDQNFIVEMGLIAQTPIVLPEVRYDLGSAVLQVIDGVIDSRDSLNFVFNLLNEYPGMVLKLISHTDSRGSAAANEKLAQARAESCVRYLVDIKGVNPERLVPVGRGENQPRKIYLIQGGDYVLKRPAEGVVFEEIELTEKYINQFQRSNKELFERLHQYNRRTEAEVIRMDWKPGESAAEEEEEEGASEE